MNKRKLNTGEMTQEEIEFKREKEKIQKELFRCETIENFIRVDKESFEEMLKAMQEKYDTTQEQMR